MPWFPILLVAHIGLAVSLLLPSILLPFVLRSREPGEPYAPGALTGILLAFQGTGSVVIAIGLAVTGAGLLAILGPDLLRKPWLLAALTIYAANLLLAAFVSRPNLRRLLRMRATADLEADADAWRRRARRQRLLAYAMALATGLIGFLMSTKPQF